MNGIKDIPTSSLDEKVFDFLESILNKDSKVLEIGSGRSTAWIANRVKHIVSFEHDKGWYNFTKNELRKANIYNCGLIFDSLYPEKGIRDLNGIFDVIIIDGRGRVKSAETTFPYLKDGGYFILDDSQRERYSEINDVVESCEEVIVVDGIKGRQTTIWRKQNKSFLKLALVYDPVSSKLHPKSYSTSYRGMFDALINRFDKVYGITKDCSAQDIDADIIIFYDVNSCHHIQIDGIEKHPAIKMEYMSDPHQREVFGTYMTTGLPVHKLSAEQRIQRAYDRGIDFIISPVKEKFFEFLGKHLNGNAESILLHFPQTPSFKSCSIPLVERKHEILGNGATWANEPVYEFRKWAFQQNNITFVKHFFQDENTPSGYNYRDLLVQYAGGLAFCEYYSVNKYYEMPMAGMLTFIQYQKDYEELGFKDFEHCIYVDWDDFKDRTKDFLNDIDLYQKIADAGRELMESKYTASHFADFIYKKCESCLVG